MRSLAIIPARGGSKRLPRKNIRPFCGKPIISYSIETAKKSKLFDTIMVSTDDKEIADIAKSFGADVPFLRTPEASNDTAGILEVIEEVLETYSKKNVKFDQICCLFATAPLVREEDLIQSQKIFIEQKLDSIFPVVRFSYPIQRGLKFEGQKIEMIWPENYDKRSQDLPLSFHDAGQFYWIQPEACFKKNKIFTDNSGAIEVSELLVQDIDTDTDWKLCELKYQLSRSK